MLSMQRPLPSMLIVMPWRFSVPVKSSLVNWLPWSVLKISGRPYRESAYSSASTQASAPSVFAMALGGQPRRHPARTVVGPGQILPIDQHHDCMLLLADRRRLAVNRGARYRQQPALLRNRQYQVLTLDQRATFGSAHLPSFRDK